MIRRGDGARFAVVQRSSVVLVVLLLDPKRSKSMDATCAQHAVTLGLSLRHNRNSIRAVDLEEKVGQHRGAPIDGWNDGGARLVPDPLVYLCG